MSYIIRDHDMQRFEQKKALMEAAVAYINKKYGDIVTLEMKDQYYNMREKVEPHYFIVERAIKAIEMAGIQPKVQPIRGGTDGARLSFMGLPCPNIFAGGHNFHGKLEFVPVESMEKATEVIKNLIALSGGEQSRLDGVRSTVLRALVDDMHWLRKLRAVRQLSAARYG